MYTIRTILAQESTFSGVTYYCILNETGKVLCRTESFLDANLIINALNQYKSICSKGV
jgi:hypothetical protein